MTAETGVRSILRGLTRVERWVAWLCAPAFVFVGAEAIGLVLRRVAFLQDPQAPLAVIAPLFMVWVFAMACGVAAPLCSLLALAVVLRQAVAAKRGTADQEQRGAAVIWIVVTLALAASVRAVFVMATWRGV